MVNFQQFYFCAFYFLSSKLLLVYRKLYLTIPQLDFPFSTLDITFPRQQSLTPNHTSRRRFLGFLKMDD